MGGTAKPGHDAPASFGRYYLIATGLIGNPTPPVLDAIGFHYGGVNQVCGLAQTGKAIKASLIVEEFGG